MSAQCDHVLHMFQVVGSAGLFSGDMRRNGIGNPSQRISELERAGYTFREQREKYPSGRGYGTRWFISSRPDKSLVGSRSSATGTANHAVVEAGSTKDNLPQPNQWSVSPGGHEHEMMLVPEGQARPLVRCAIDDDWEAA